MDEDYALQNAVNIYGGAGNDSVYVRHNANTYIDLSQGGADIIVTAGEANARVSIAGYQASTGAAIRVEEYLDVKNQKAGSIAEGIENGIISFGEGTVYITSTEGKSELYLGTNGAGGQIVNLMTHATSGNEYKQAVGFTGSDGGLVDGSTYTSPLIMIGNSDNTDSAGSSLVGGSANDTFYAGANDYIDVGYGNDLVKLYDDATRAGAVVDIGNGRTTIEGMNNTLADSTGDILHVAIDPKDSTFSLLYNDSLQALAIESSADGYYALLTDVDTLEGNYTTQYIYDEIGNELYSVAIGTVNSTIQVTEDEDLRPNVFFGYQTAIDFRGYTGDAIIDLRGDMAESIIDETIVIIDDDITTLYAGIGDTALKGDLDDETLYAGKGNTWLYGDGGKNLLVGYNGIDKEGQTVFYVLGNEDGAAHTISGFNYVNDNNYTDNKKVTADALEFDLDDNNITRIDISGNDLVIEITDKAGTDTESALLKDAINADGTGKDFIVSDNVAQVADNHLVFDQFADYYYATGKNATVEVSGRIEDDVVLWLDEDDTGKVFEGDIAVIDATNSDATAQLAGNENDNAIFAGTGETSLWGGEGGNDLLVGNGGGRDTFYYSSGEDTSAITDLYASDYPTTIKQTGGASYVQTAGGESGAGQFIFEQSEQSFEAGPAEDSDDEDADGVRFVINNNGVSAIEDVSDKEFVFGSSTAFAGVSQVNGQSFDVTGAGYLEFIGTEDSDGVSQLIAFDGEDVVVNNAAGASYVGAREVDSITFDDNTFEISGTSGNKRGVLFIVDDELTVSGLSHVGSNGSNESVTGGFSTVTNINGQNFAVTNDDEIMVVGNDEPGITKIAKVSDGAEIENVGGASQVITDTEGVFTFAGNSFLVLGDSSVAFEMVDGAAASVAGITDFATNGESRAVVAGKLNGLYINDEDKTIDVEGDDDDILAYVKETYEGEEFYGLAVAGSNVTVNGAASATIIETGSDGVYTFAMDKDAASTTYTVASAGDSAVLFEVEGNQVVGILDMDKNTSVTGDFSNGAYVEGLSAAGEDLQFVQITGDSSVTVVYDEFEVRNLSNGASISSATTFKHAYTDEDTNAITVTDASGDEFTVEGDPDGVHYLLNGEGEIIGVDDLDEGATLKGALGALSSINGKDFDVKEEILNYAGLSAGDGQFAIVGGSNGIGSIVDLGGSLSKI